MCMEIRAVCTDDDRSALSRIYEESWKSAYRGIIPQSYLDSIAPGLWIPNFDRVGLYSLVLIENGSFIGSASYCPSRFDKYKGFGEIVSIYLLPEYMGRGFGKPLLDAAMAALAGMGFQDLFLWVLEENFRARRFYEKAGFSPSGDYLEDNIGGKALRELQYCYHME